MQVQHLIFLPLSAFLLDMSVMFSADFFEETVVITRNSFEEMELCCCH